MSSVPDNETLAQLVAGVDLAYADERTTTIGLIATDWNLCEECLQIVIWDLAGLDHEMGECITTDMANLSRLNLAKNILNRFHKTEPFYTRLMQILALYDECRQARNFAIHNVIIADENRYVAISRTMKSGRGVLNIRPAPDGEELNATLNAIGCLIMAFRDMLRVLSDEPPTSPEKDFLPVFLELLKALRLERVGFDYLHQSS